MKRIKLIQFHELESVHCIYGMRKLKLAFLLTVNKYLVSCGIYQPNSCNSLRHTILPYISSQSFPFQFHFVRMTKYGIIPRQLNRSGLYWITKYFLKSLVRLTFLAVDAKQTWAPVRLQDSLASHSQIECALAIVPTLQHSRSIVL